MVRHQPRHRPRDPHPHSRPPPLGGEAGWRRCAEQIRNPRLPDFSADELRRVVERAKAEILADVAAGTVPSTCASFSELHDYTDANGYGGAFERPFDNNETDFWNAVQDAVDAWIKQGGLTTPH